MALLNFLPENSKINFVGARFFAFTIDGLLLAAAIISIAFHGFNLGIDFTGGVLLEVKAERTIDVHQMRADVASLGFGDPQVQTFGGGSCDTPKDSCVLIRVQPKDYDKTATAEDASSFSGAGRAVADAIKAKLGPDYTLRNTQIIGPKVSGELFHAGVLATVLAVLAIAAYVAVRFEWQYGVGAVFATGHDVLVTAGLYSLFHLDFTLTSIAALLTLAGYSINDTVVVFDRIRENRRKYKRMPLGELINLSTNQMFTRTILTSTTTAISVIPLLIFGGAALFDFTAAILFGIIVGTFSSIYVAAMILLYLPAPAGTQSGGGREESEEAQPA